MTKEAIDAMLDRFEACMKEFATNSEKCRQELEEASSDMTDGQRLRMMFITVQFGHALGNEDLHGDGGRVVCQHEHYKKHGLHRDGRQRLRCKDCGQTWITDRNVNNMNRLSPEEEFKLVLALCLGKSNRQISKQFGHSFITIERRRQQIGALPIADDKVVPKGFARCDYCGKKITGEREMFRKTSRTKHKFCNHDCYGLWQRKQTANDKCKRCHRIRKEIGLCTVFSNGMCPKCYNLLRQFDGDEQAAALFELNQQLKKEIRNGEIKARKARATH